MQVKIDLTRTIGFISGIIPGLRYNDLHLLRCVGVGHRQPGSRIAGITHRISGRDILFHYRIDDLLPVFIDIQIRKPIGPVVRSNQHTLLPGAHAIRIQRHFCIIRTDTILIISICPDLARCHYCLPGCVAVGYIISVYTL